MSMLTFLHKVIPWSPRARRAKPIKHCLIPQYQSWSLVCKQLFQQIAMEASQLLQLHSEYKTHLLTMEIVNARLVTATMYMEHLESSDSSGLDNTTPCPGQLNTMAADLFAQRRKVQDALAENFQQSKDLLAKHLLSYKQLLRDTVDFMNFLRDFNASHSNDAMVTSSYMLRTVSRFYSGHLLNTIRQVNTVAENLNRRYNRSFTEKPDEPAALDTLVGQVEKFYQLLYHNHEVAVQNKISVLLTQRCGKLWNSNRGKATRGERKFVFKKKK